MIFVNILNTYLYMLIYVCKFDTFIPAALKAVHARGAFSLMCCGSGSQVKSLWTCLSLLLYPLRRHRPTCFPCSFALWIWTSGLVCLQV